MEGVIGINPKLKKVEWTQPSKIVFYFEDGREITVPTKLLPSVKKSKPEKRNKPQIINGQMFTWDGCPEVYHIEQILGKEEDYKYHSAEVSS